ncbi:MAG: hypothetical protein R3242_01085 [Akkermansiaceae bacterium]|nr:hypothetical protein [Akkermansiaceae bacterium]
MQHTILLLSLLAFLVVPALSQDIKKSDRTCRMVFPEKPDKAPSFVYLYDGKNNHKVYLSAVNFSDVIELESGDITLVMAPNPIDDPKAIPADYPRISVSERIRNFYLFLSIDQNNKKFPFRVQMINLDDGTFRPGNTLWCNFTQHRIAAKLGDSKMSLPPGKTTISGEPLSEDGYYIAQFLYQPNAAGEYRKITEQSWWFDADCRYVGFIADRGGALPKIYFFRDFRLPKEVIEAARRAEADGEDGLGANEPAPAAPGP